MKNAFKRRLAVSVGMSPNGISDTSLFNPRSPTRLEGFFDFDVSTPYPGTLQLTDKKKAPEKWMVGWKMIARFSCLVAFHFQVRTVRFLGRMVFGIHP